MKKLFLVGAFALFGAMNAQQNSVKLNPFAILGGSDLLTYERAVGEQSSVGVGAGYGGFKIADNKYTNLGASVFYRYYFSEALKGWYGMGGIAYNNGKVTTTGYDENFNTTEEKVNFNSFGGTVKVGYQWLWDSGFTLDLNGGLGYSSFKYDQSGTVNDGLKASGLLPAFGLALGYSW